MTVAYSLVQKPHDTEDGDLNVESPSELWKKGGIIGAAALAGGTLMAVTGGIYSLTSAYQSVFPAEISDGSKSCHQLW